VFASKLDSLDADLLAASASVGAYVSAVERKCAEPNHDAGPADLPTLHSQAETAVTDLFMSARARMFIPGAASRGGVEGIVQEARKLVDILMRARTKSGEEPGAPVPNARAATAHAHSGKRDGESSAPALGSTAQELQAAIAADEAAVLQAAREGVERLRSAMSLLDSDAETLSKTTATHSELSGSVGAGAGLASALSSRESSDLRAVGAAVALLCLVACAIALRRLVWTFFGVVLPLPW
jgi:hypothetical protein